MSFTRDDLKRVGWTALQAFLATLLVMAPGILEAPNLGDAKALAVAALVAAISAAISAVKNLVLSDGNALK